jgi:hypothetical protein
LQGQQLPLLPPLLLQEEWLSEPSGFHRPLRTAEQKKEELKQKVRPPL